LALECDESVRRCASLFSTEAFMFAGAAKIDITPASPVWMDGMIRAHRSAGVHDTLYARCLVLGDRLGRGTIALITIDVCALGEATCGAMRRAAAVAGLLPECVLVAATHTHSGPATFGFFNPREDDYNAWLAGRVGALVAAAVAAMQPACVACGSGREETISHYRRFLADDGHVVMIWEPFAAQRLRGALGEADPQVGVLKVTQRAEPHNVIALLINHAGHPNVMSGDSYLLSPDYPGQACRLLEQQLGGVALFANGAQGSVDVDGLRDRDWDGVARLGARLARAAGDVARSMVPAPSAPLACASAAYDIPQRTITAPEWAWAQDILRRTGGAVASMADGVGDDYVALLYKELRAVDKPIAVTQTCLAIGDCALLTFPGELYTEIGLHIKAKSAFRHTCIIGLANGYIGYIPTRRAISEGGYSEITRRVDAAAEEIVVQHSLELLQSVHDSVHLEEQ
jgi:neutral ceramidase